MTGTSNRSRTGADALAKLAEYFEQTGLVTDPRDTARRFVARLLQEGFIVAPVPYSKPARRGNAKPPKYTGPAMIGQSHSARIVGS